MASESTYSSSNIYLEREPFVRVPCHDALDTPNGSTDIADNATNDIFRAQVQGWRFYLENEFGMPIRTCADVSAFCTLPAGNMTDEVPYRMKLVRMVCPVTCGCNSLTRGSAIGGSAFDCPSFCDRSDAILEEDRAAMTCADTAPADSEVLRTWLDEFTVIHGNSYFKDNFTALGCAYLADYAQLGYQICGGPLSSTRLTFFGNQYKFWTMFCPDTCNCHGRYSYDRPYERFCPTACF